MRLHVLRESAVGEARVSATPETVKKLSALGVVVSIEAGAGNGSFTTGEVYTVGAAVDLIFRNGYE